MTLSPDDITRLRGLVADSTFTARFELEREIGAGGMGRVFVATDKTGDRKIAIKLLDPGLHGDAERFAKEADILERLEHPAIVAYVAHGVTSDGRAYLAMAWLEGESLSERLRRGPLATLDAVLVGARVAGALAYLHDRQVVHRDIKPSNVFLVGGDPAAATVIDLGIAKQLGATDKLTRTGQLVGTPGYMAPEQVMGEATIDGRVDLFALGCLLYESLTGRLPFPGDAVMEVLAHLLLHEPPALDEVDPNIPARLATVVAILLAKEANDRTIDAAAAAAELTAIADALVHGDAKALASSRFARPVSAKAATLADARHDAVTARSPAARKPSRVPLIAVLAPLAAVIAIAVSILASREPPPPDVIAASPPQTLRVRLPDRITGERTPGPLLQGAIVDAATPDQLGAKLRAAVWCRARDRVVAVTEDRRVVAIGRDLAIEPLATLAAGGAGEAGRDRDAAVVCLDDKRVLVAVRDQTFAIADGRATPGPRLPGAVADAVAHGETAHWLVPGAIVAWSGGGDMTPVRAACDRPERLSPAGDHVLCTTADKRHTLDGVALPAADQPAFAADGTLYYERAGTSYRWRGGEHRVAAGGAPLATAGWLVTHATTTLSATSLRDPRTVHELTLGLHVAARVAIPEHDEVLVELGSGQGLRIVAAAAPAIELPADRHRDAIRALAFSSDGTALVSSSMMDARVITRQRDGSNRHVMAKPTRQIGTQPLLWLRDGRIALLGAGNLTMWNPDGTVTERELPRGVSRAVPGTDEILRASADGIARVGAELEPIAKIPLARVVRDFEIDRAKRRALVETTGTISATVLEVESGRSVLELAEPTNRTIFRTALVDGEEPTLVVRDSAGQVFLVESQRVTSLLAAPATTRATNDLVVAPTGRRVAIIAGREAIVYDVAKHRETARVELPTEVTAAAWDWTGMQLAVAGSTTEIRVYAVP